MARKRRWSYWNDCWVDRQPCPHGLACEAGRRHWRVPSHRRRWTGGPEGPHTDLTVSESQACKNSVLLTPVPFLPSLTNVRIKAADVVFNGLAKSSLIGLERSSGETCISTKARKWDWLGAQRIVLAWWDDTWTGPELHMSIMEAPSKETASPTLPLKMATVDDHVLYHVTPIPIPVQTDWVRGSNWPKRRQTIDWPASYDLNWLKKMS